MDSLVRQEVVSYHRDLGTSGLRGDIDESRAVQDHRDGGSYAVGIGASIGECECVGGVTEARNRGSGRKGLLVGSGIGASEQGIHVIKGVPDQWSLFAVGG